MSHLQQATHLLIERSGNLATSLQAEYPRLAQLLTELHRGMTLVPIEVLYVVVMFAAASLIVGAFVFPLSGFSTYVERRVAGRIQARIGCNRVGPEGLLQFLADGIKLFTKEDNIPLGADRVLFRLAPYLVVLGALLSFVCIPFGKYLYVADLNVGLFYLISISSLVVVGILLAGWSSNNKWSLLGAMRSAAQMISYEIPVALALMVPILLAGTFSLVELNRIQAGGMRHWIVFAAPPAALIALVVYFISSLAETNRTPFDLPEAESELVSGYNTEYSGMRWGLFFVAEYANMFLVSAIAVTAFLGGWQPSRSNIVFATGAFFFTFILAIKSLTFFIQLVLGLLRGQKLFFLLSNVRPVKFKKWWFGAIAGISILLATALQMLFADVWFVTFLMFVAKVYFVVFVMMWIRWTLPRIRIDQMMALCWKKLVPIAFGCVFWTALFMIARG